MLIKRQYKTQEDIEYTNDFVQNAQLDDDLVKVTEEPQPWQFKQLQDAANYGVELLWPWSDTLITRDKGEEPRNSYYLRLTKELFAFMFPGFLQIPDNHSLLIIPHYSHAIVDDPPPRPLTQMVEMDWWPNPMQIIFEMPTSSAWFRQDKPFAQALAVPRQGYTIKDMDTKEADRKQAAMHYIKKHRAKFCTRHIEHDGLADQDNVYERLAHMQRSGELPPEIKDQKKVPKLKTKWK